MGSVKEQMFDEYLRAHDYCGTVSDPEDLSIGGMIYMMVFPNGKQYVGLTTEGLRTRMRKHRADARRLDKPTKPVVHKALLKYGFENVNVSVLESNIRSDDLLKLREQYYVKRFNTLRPAGYNSTEGGDHIARKTPDQLEKMAEKLKTAKVRYAIVMYARTGERLKTFDRVEDIRLQHPEFVISHIYSACSGYKKSAHGYLWRKYLRGDEVAEHIEPFSCADAARNISQSVKPWTKIPLSHALTIRWLILDGLPVESIAEIYGCTVGAVRQLCKRIQRDLLNGETVGDEE